MSSQAYMCWAIFVHGSMFNMCPYKICFVLQQGEKHCYPDYDNKYTQFVCLSYFKKSR